MRVYQNARIHHISSKTQHLSYSSNLNLEPETHKLTGVGAVGGENKSIEVLLENGSF